MNPLGFGTQDTMRLMSDACEETDAFLAELPLCFVYTRVI